MAKQETVHFSIVCETGGKLAHLATLAREFDKSIVRMENATLLFMKKEKVIIDFELGKIEYQTDNIKKKMKP